MSENYKQRWRKQTAIIQGDFERFLAVLRSNGTAPLAATCLQRFCNGTVMRCPALYSKMATVGVK